MDGPRDQGNPWADNDDLEDDEWWALPDPAPPERHLSTEVASLVAPEVGEAVEFLFGRVRDHYYFPREPDDFLQWWAHRCGVLPEGQVELLKQAVEPVALPAGAQRAWELASGISQFQAPMLAAALLRDQEPDWWAQLPWVHQTPPRGDHLALLEREQWAATNQPELVEAMNLPNQGGLWLGDLPKSFGVDDQAKMFIAARAFLEVYDHDVGDWDLLTQKCTACGASFYRSSLWLVTLLWAGTNQYCRTCATMAQKGYAWDVILSPDLLEEECVVNARSTAVRGWTEAYGGPPARAQVLDTPIVAFQENDRHRELVHRMLVSRMGSWTKVLHHADVIPDGWRPSRGVLTYATDGHLARSLFERHVDDWLHNNNVVHTCEPRYPKDASLNPKGGLRADWRLEDGTFVEAAGMMQSPDYQEKMRIKAELAARHGIELVILTPVDLTQLATVFAGHLRS